MKLAHLTFIAGLLALSACSPAKLPTATSSTGTPVIGQPGPQQALVRLMLPNLKAVTPQYLNLTKTASLSVAVDNGAPTTVALSNLSCAASGCPVDLYVAAGQHTFTVKSYSAAQVLISQGSQSLNVVLGQNNPLDLTLDPVNANYSLRSAVQQVDPVTRTIGNYTRFRFSGGHSLVAYYDVLAQDAVGDSLGVLVCGDTGVAITNISDAAHPNRYKVELTTPGDHMLTAKTGSSCAAGSVLATQALKTIQGTRVAGGSGHSLALLADGTVRAWGDNYYGQLGNATTHITTPVQVSGIGGPGNPAAAVPTP